MAALKKASLSLTDSVWLLRVIFVSKSCLFVFGRTKARLLSTSLRGSLLMGTWSVSFHQLYYWCSFWTTCAVWRPRSHFLLAGSAYDRSGISYVKKSLQFEFRWTVVTLFITTRPCVDLIFNVFFLNTWTQACLISWFGSWYISKVFWSFPCT